MRARVLVRGKAAGPVLRLTENLSFWGGVDPRTGRVIDSRHPQYGSSVAGAIVVLERSVGSSSGSSILLELLSRGVGPAGIILGVPDQILTLGAVVAREMGLGAIPVVQVDPGRFEALSGRVRIGKDGSVARCRAHS